MVQVFVKIEGIGRVTKTMTNYARRIPKAGRRGTWLFANKMARGIRNEAKARGHVTTGYLSSAKGTHVRKLDMDNYAIKMPYYTQFLESGTGPHWIPRMYKTELFARKAGMSFHSFRKGVATKGTKPHSIIAPVITRETNNAKGIISKQINDAIKKR